MLEARQRNDEFQVDDRAFPLVLVTFPNQPSDRSIPLYYQRLAQLARRGRFILVADIRPLRLTSVDAQQRKLFAEQAKLWDEGPGRGRLIAEGVVLDSPVARGLVRSYLWLKGQGDYETLVFGSVDEARRWAREYTGEYASGR